MPSDTVQRLERAYRCGELDDLKASILPFVRNNRVKLLDFMRNFQHVEGPRPLDQLIKFFILQHNMPFDMGQYMAKQSSTIKREIGGQTSDEDICHRQACVAKWIREKAADHRSVSMFQQVFCFEKAKDELLPLIEDELNLHGVS